MNYRSISDLNTAIIKNLYKIPIDVDLIVGIPRSGMMVASLIALHRNLPFVDIDGFLNGKIFYSGNTSRIKIDDNFLKIRRKVLVIDDSLYHGYAIKKVKEKIENANCIHKILFGVAYITPGKENEVDIFFEKLGHPRIFEWNLFRNEVIIPKTCFDLDGVLCRDPSQEENDDGVNYLKFIENVEPLKTPKIEIGWIVTSRLEKYRDATIKWLNKHSIKYKKLIMLDLPDMETRIATNCHATFKAKIFSSVPADLFIESSIKQAIEIARLTKKNVLCIETSEMLHANMINEYRMRINYTLSSTMKTTVYRLACKIRREIKAYFMMRNSENSPR